MSEIIPMESYEVVWKINMEEEIFLCNGYGKVAFESISSTECSQYSMFCCKSLFEQWNCAKLLFFYSKHAYDEMSAIESCLNKNANQKKVTAK